MLAIFHGYPLDGSGSCIYVENVTRYLAKNGRDLILFCQEPLIESFPFVTEAYTFNERGGLDCLFRRTQALPGKVICFIPYLKNNVLPVFVPGKFSGFENVKAFTTLTDQELEDYIVSNVEALKAVIRSHQVTILFGQHIVMSSYITCRAARTTQGVKYYIFPHGSEIEYLINVDERYRPMAREALEHASGIITGNKEMAQRVSDLFEGGHASQGQLIHIPIGVDADYFSEPRGWPISSRVAAFREQVRKEIRDHVDSPDHPDSRLEENLTRIDFEKKPVLCNVGRLLPAKGVHELIVIAPKLLRSHPDLTIVIAGTGPYERMFKQMVQALQSGDEMAFSRLLSEETASTQGVVSDPYRSLHTYLRQQGTKAYFDSARSFHWSSKVVFAGYLRHPSLRLLLSLCKVSIFPSIVEEAYGLTLYEAAAAGSFPIATDFGGLKDGLDKLGKLLAPEMRQIMRLPVDETLRLETMVNQISLALERVNQQTQDQLSDVVRQQFSWTTIAGHLDSLFTHS